jgi:hypothetical protein
MIFGRRHDSGGSRARGNGYRHCLLKKGLIDKKYAAKHIARKIYAMHGIDFDAKQIELDQQVWPLELLARIGGSRPASYWIDWGCSLWTGARRPPTRGGYGRRKSLPPRPPGRPGRQAHFLTREWLTGRIPIRDRTASRVPRRDQV